MKISACCRLAYRNILIVYAAICALWIPINFWMMPWHAIQIGQVSAQHAVRIAPCIPRLLQLLLSIMALPVIAAASGS